MFYFSRIDKSKMLPIYISHFYWMCMYNTTTRRMVGVKRGNNKDWEMDNFKIWSIITKFLSNKLKFRFKYTSFLHHHSLLFQVYFSNKFINNLLKYMGISNLVCDMLIQSSYLIFFHFLGVQ